MSAGAPGSPPAKAFIADESMPTGFRFKCLACGWTDCRRVSVKRPAGGHYQTEFVACGWCQAMYHWWSDPPRVPLSPSAKTDQEPGS